MADIRQVTIGGRVYDQMNLPSGLLMTRVSDRLWRVAQPKSLEDTKVMYTDLGIRTRVKLNTEQEGSDDCVRAAAIRVINCAIEPIGAGSLIVQALAIFEKPDPAKIEKALRVMCNEDEGADGNVIVGCQHNHDRTGLLVGLYRARYGGLTKSEAWDEMVDFGYHPELVGLDRDWWDDNAAGTSA